MCYACASICTIKRLISKNNIICSIGEIKQVRTCTAFTLILLQTPRSRTANESKLLSLPSPIIPLFIYHNNNHVVSRFFFLTPSAVHSTEKFMQKKHCAVRSFFESMQWSILWFTTIDTLYICFSPFQNFRPYKVGSK